MSSERNKRKQTAYIKGVPRNLGKWSFGSRLKDLDDGLEFNGTEELQAKFPNHTTVPYVFSDEEAIVCEGFALTENGCLPAKVISKLSKRLSKRKT